MTEAEVKERQVRRSTLVITNAIKLAGLVLGVKELLTSRDPFFMGVCVLMMSGMQSTEQVVVRAVEKFFGID